MSNLNILKYFKFLLGLYEDFEETFKCIVCQIKTKKLANIK